MFYRSSTADESETEGARGAVTHVMNETSSNGSSERLSAMQVAQQLSSLAQSLSAGLNEMESERAAAVSRVAELETVHGQAVADLQEMERKYQDALERVEQLEEKQRKLKEAASSNLDPQNLQTLKGLMNSLAENPHHIIYLARVSEHAPQLQAVVDDYTRLRGAVAGS